MLDDRVNNKPIPTEQSHQLNWLEIELAPKKIAKFLGLVVIGLLLASTLGQFSAYFLGRGGFLVPLFYIDYEHNIPSIYSSFALLLCCLLLAAIAIAKKQEGDRYTNHWRGLSYIFLYLSLDEATSLHERAGETLGKIFNRDGITPYIGIIPIDYAWLILGAIFVSIFCLCYFRFLFSLPAKTKYWFTISGLGYTIGAMGVELISAYYKGAYGAENLGLAMISTVEEGLEMASIVIFIYALTQYIKTYIKSIRISFENR
ncbi:MAG: hypothetical protein MUD14_18275 [Hydrococcus sp. Prado102]|jgi:hypothetical protein|nr:hypothetical protein [Hydrococcus sp. Prado102]